MHWHAFAYNGSKYPDDSAAKTPGVAVRPLTVSHWFNKPKQMHKGAFSDADSAFAWLERELSPLFPEPERLPEHLRFYRGHLELGQDAYAGGYQKDNTGIYVRCLLTCPRTGADKAAVTCPGAP